MSPTQVFRMFRSQSGSALVLCLLALLALSILGLSLLGASTTDFNIARNWTNRNEAFYAAEAGVEQAAMRLRGLLASFPSPTDPQLAAVTTTPPITPPANTTFAGFAVTRTIPGPAVPYLMPFATGPYQGLSGIVTDYQITNTASRNNSGSTPATARVSQGMQYIQIPLFQFMPLYGKGVDLEIAPGPPMNLNGRVHSNSNIYLGAGSTLNIDSYMTTVGKVLRQIKRDLPGTLRWENDPQIKDAGGVYQTLNFDHLYNQSVTSWSESAWKAQALSTFGGKVQDSSMNVPEIIPPVPTMFLNPDAIQAPIEAHKMIEMPQGGDTPAMVAAKLYSKAGVIIKDGVARNQGGTIVPLPGVISTQSFWDDREQRTMTVTQIDVGALTALNPSALANGVLYVARTDGAGGTAPAGNAVRLVNGSTLPSQGLSVVSPNPTYVQGDYNTVAQKPAAILGDAITVLSNNWTPNGSDLLGNQTPDQRQATATTINAAFALGPSVESVSNNGNGQLENLIRFLEDWSGVNFNYAGSLVALWHSQKAQGQWLCCPYYYNPPNRNWSYDVSFDAVQPPGTPAGVIMTKARWTTKN